MGQCVLGAHMPDNSACRLPAPPRASLRLTSPFLQALKEYEHSLQLSPDNRELSLKIRSLTKLFKAKSTEKEKQEKQAHVRRLAGGGGGRGARQEHPTSASMQCKCGVRAAPPGSGVGCSLLLLMPHARCPRPSALSPLRPPPTRSPWPA